MIESHRYRADIDGLRALAIVPVVLFHAGVPGFGGGYVGVDVFFVISGYLITSIIERDIRAGQFSLLSFYERRVRRILPALFATLFVCALIAAFLLHPAEAVGFARSLVAAAVFVSSFLFRRESGYFDVEAELKPLLHTWSLSVEEIFYIVFPLVLLFTWHRVRGHRVQVLVAIALLSFTASVIALHQDAASRAAFFLPHLRAWELLIGALIALTPLRLPTRRPIGALTGAFGLCLIVVPVFAYSEATTFPGIAALAPCVGAALIIVAGQQRPTAIGRLLAMRPVVFLGLISYSLYLWHWPIFVFTRQWIGRDPGPAETVMMIAGSLIVAVLSWRYIERPFRGASGILRRPALFATAGATAALLIGIGIHGQLTGGWLGRFPPELATILASAEDIDQRRNECLGIKPDAPGCLYGQVAAPPVLALWGDSHAAVFSVMLGDLAAERGASVLAMTMPSCPPARNWQIEGQAWRDSCARFQRRAWQRITETESIHTVVLSARFNGYPLGDSESDFTEAFLRTAAELLDAGLRVSIVYPVPQLGANVPKVLAAAVLDQQDPALLAQPIATYLKATRKAFALLDSVPDHPALVRIHPHRLLCPGADCIFYRDGRSLYAGEHHLSLTGAVFLRSLFAPLFDDPRSRAVDRFVLHARD
jgi:peptidoglycan/LPS O-acetylase OafA/YrhL